MALPQGQRHELHRTSFTKSTLQSAALHRDTEMAGEFSPMALQPHPVIAPSSFQPVVLLKSVSFLGVLFLGWIL